MHSSSNWTTKILYSICVSDVYMGMIRLVSKTKLEGESFSDTIARLVKGGGRLSDCAGLWSDMGEEERGEILASTKEMRKTLNELLR